LIGLLAAIGLPSYRQVGLKSKATAVMNDFRTFSGALVTYNLQQARWPAGTGVPGEIPAEMTNNLAPAFTRPTPIGGYYEWVSNSTYKAAIRIVTTASSPMSDDAELVELVDKLMDDGSLGTGSVQLVAGNLVYVIEP
jgi:type II secretory pathway pseudopilin PulG